MNKQKVFIAGTVIFLFILLLVYFFSREDENAVKKFVSDKWQKEFILESKDPQGLSLFKELVEDYSKKASVIEDSLEYQLDSTSTYIFAGDQFSLHPQEFDSILKQVNKGADLFLSYHELTNNIRNIFFYDIFNEFYFNYEIEVYSAQEKFHVYSVFQTDTIARTWKLIRQKNLIDTNHVVLSEIMETPNFVKLKHGKGNIYLHTTPELFFNYQLLTKDGFAHAQFVIKHLQKKHKIKWLELGRLSDEFGNSDTNEMEGEDGRKDDSLLKFMFSKKELVIAMLLTVLGIILYLIFRTKRYWPVVPYLPKSKNRSLDFADTMTAIYFNQQSPYSILIVMRKNFRSNINKQFFLDIAKENNALEIKLLSEKSGIDIQQVEILVRMLENVKMQAVTYEFIQEVAKRQREFYLQTGIIKHNVRIKGEKKKIEFKRQIIISSSLIFLGINGIIRGFYELAQANGPGIILWPIGIIVLVGGVLLFNRKLMLVENGKLTYYPYFIGKKEFELDEILDVKAEKGITIITFTGNRILKINHFEISHYSRKDFEHFIAPFLK